MVAEVQGCVGDVREAISVRTSKHCRWLANNKDKLIGNTTKLICVSEIWSRWEIRQVGGSGKLAARRRARRFVDPTRRRRALESD